MENDSLTKEEIEAVLGIIFELQKEIDKMTEDICKQVQSHRWSPNTADDQAAVAVLEAKVRKIKVYLNMCDDSKTYPEGLKLATNKLRNYIIYYNYIEKQKDKNSVSDDNGNSENNNLSV